MHLINSRATFHPISGTTKTPGPPESRNSGGPTSKVETNFDAILDEIYEGAALTKSLRKRNISGRAFYAFLNATEDKANPDRPSERYAQARVGRRELRFEKITEIAEKAKPENAHVARLQVDVVKWQLSKEDPAKYGDKPLTVNTGPTTNNILIVGDAALEELQAARRSLLEATSLPTRET